MVIGEWRWLLKGPSKEAHHPAGFRFLTYRAPDLSRPELIAPRTPAACTPGGTRTPQTHSRRPPPSGAGSHGCKAAGVGFEPTEPVGSTTFKAVAFDRSATPPALASVATAPCGFVVFKTVSEVSTCRRFFSRAPVGAPGRDLYTPGRCSPSRRARRRSHKRSPWRPRAVRSVGHGRDESCRHPGAPGVLLVLSSRRLP
jgi:hypothetical protein